MINRFEDAPGWWQARRLANLVYDASERWPFVVASLLADDGFRQSIRTLAAEAVHEIVRGFISGAPLAFSEHLKEACGSVGVLLSELYLALDRGYLDVEQFQELYLQAEKVKACIPPYLHYLQSLEAGDCLASVEGDAAGKDCTAGRNCAAGRN